ncbi:MAG: deoxyguanosinetriphosphate triphosphohydrolase [Alphaproteobacteria bacterium GM202ARS2]|nr:deoxyguanosinetriphosphate triphosphohydrolase [Alphaproteobacteria bacterium GM202ARS2]
MKNNPADWHPYLAPYASHVSLCRGRLHPEPEDNYRTPWQRDKDRILHSVAFRRLELKTQVFMATEGDHHRTRLTHTLEVAQIARSLARCLAVHEDLTEAIALAHDLGHPPFGHVGETALQAMTNEHGGFDHNDQTLRIITHLETRYPTFAGLNLTWETLEGIAKHNGPVKPPYPYHLAAYSQRHNLDLKRYPTLEAQIAAIADDIAYNSHDIDDGLRRHMFTLDDIPITPIIELRKTIIAQYPRLTLRQQRHALVRELIKVMVADVRTTSQAAIDAAKVKSNEDVRNVPHALINFSPQMNATIEQLRAFLSKKVYHHPQVDTAMNNAQKKIRYLFTYWQRNPERLPEPWAQQFITAHKQDPSLAARILSDYIAGMTDRFALQCHQRIDDERKR